MDELVHLDLSHLVTAGDINAYINAIKLVALDIDGDGSEDALTDGLLLIRHMFGLTGDALIQDAISAGATRTTAAEITAFIEQFMP